MISSTVRNDFPERIANAINSEFNKIDGLISKIVLPIFADENGNILGVLIGDKLINHSNTEIRAQNYGLLGFTCSNENGRMIKVNLEGVFKYNDVSWNRLEIENIAKIKLNDNLGTIFTNQTHFRADLVTESNPLFESLITIIRAINEISEKKLSLG